jgi:ubiquinone biosynthesis accessory factor UbiK
LIVLTRRFHTLSEIAIMFDPEFFEEINAWIPEVIAASLARDLENNLRVMITAMSANLELVTREDFDLQAQVLQRTREKLDALEVRLARLAQTGHSGAGPDPGA